MKLHRHCMVGALLFLAATPGFAQPVSTYEFTAYLDADVLESTGCSVTLPGLGITIDGVEFQLTAEVGDQPRQVLDVYRAECGGGSFGPPVSLGASYPVGFDNGLSGGDVIEWSEARNQVTQDSGQARLYFTAENIISGAEDVLLTTDGSAGGPPIILGLFFVIPALGGFGLLILALLLALAGARNHKLLRRLAASGLLLSTFAVWAANHLDDGQVGDWSDQNPIALDPSGDQFGAESGVDLLGCFAVEEGQRVYFRCDVVDIENQPPVAMDDIGATDEDSLLNMAAPGVLGNDMDPDVGDMISVTAFDAVSTQGATVNVNADGSYSYDPTAAPMLQALTMGATVDDTFTYTISDLFGATDTATVTITVTGVNDPPVAVDDSDSTDEDTVVNVSAPGVLGNDTDVDTGATLTVTAFDAASVQGATVNVIADGSFAYDPTAAAALQALNQGDSVMDTFTYDVSDGLASDTGTVTITVTGVNDAPVAADDMAMTDEDVAVMIDVLANDVDVDGALDPASVSVTVMPAIGGTAVNPSNGIITYTPNLDQNGADSFTYEVCDNGTPVLCDTATVNITINPVDDPPVAVDDSAMVTEDDPATLIDVLANDTDVDGGPISIGSVTQPANGMVVNNGTDLTYQPNPDYCNNPPGGAPDTFMYTLTPGTSTATVSVTVDCVNDPPTVGMPGPFDVTGNISRSLPMGTLLMGASDPDGATTLTAELVGTPTNGATVMVNPDGSFSYDPGPGYTGMASFDFRVCDDGIPAPPQCSPNQTVTINIADIIWFINQGDAGLNLGTLANPFNSMASFDAVNDDTGTNPGVGDTAFLFSGTTTEGVTLLDGQFLIGQGAGASISAITGITPPPGSMALPSTGGMRPLMTTTNANAIELAMNNTLRGLDIGNTGSGDGLNGTTLGNLTISEMAIAGTGRAIFLDTGVAAIMLDAVASTSNGGIDLNSITGSFVVSGVTNITGHTGLAIRVQNGAGSTFDFGSTTLNGASGIDIGNGNAGAVFTFDAVNVTSTNGVGLTANNSGTVNIAGVTNVITATNAAALDIMATGTGTGWTFSDVSSLNSSGFGINLNAVDGNIIINGGSLSGSNSDLVHLNGGMGNFTYAGDLLGSIAGDQAEVTGRGPGNVTFSGSINATSGQGINVNNNTPGAALTVDFSNASKVINTSLANDLVRLVNNNANVAVNFTGGGLVLTNGNGGGYQANGAQTVTVQGAGNMISATNGFGLRVINSTIGVGNVTFQSISVSSNVNGIVLDNTGTQGSLIVTGNGSNTIAGNSGGTISGTTGAGLLLNATMNPTFDSMTIMNTGFHGIDGTAVNGLTFMDGLVSGAGDADTEDGIHLVNSTGMIDIDNSRFTDSAEDLLSIENTNSDVMLMVSNSQFIETAPPFGNDAITLQVQGTTNLIADISNNVFGDPAGFATGGLFGNAIDVGNAVAGGMLAATGSINLTAMDNTSNQNPADANKGGGFKVSGQDSLVIDVNYTGNVFNGAKGNGVVAFDNNDMATLEPFVGGSGAGNNNQVNNATNANGMTYLADEATDMRALVENNQVTNVGADGKQVANFGSTLMQDTDIDIGFLNNLTDTHSQGGAPFIGGFVVFGGGDVGNGANTCVRKMGNTSINAPAGFFDYYLDDFGAPNPILYEGPGMAVVMPADIVANNTAGGGAANVAVIGTQFSNSVPCQMPTP